MIDTDKVANQSHLADVKSLPVKKCCQNLYRQFELLQNVLFIGLYHDVIAGFGGNIKVTAVPFNPPSWAVDPNQLPLGALPTRGWHRVTPFPVH